jgi:hypothetical protein
MSLEQALVKKLKPHADRVVQGVHSDFDYLPAVLFQSLERDNSLDASLANHFQSIVSSFEKQNQSVTEFHAALDKLIASNIASLFKELAASQAEQEKLAELYRAKFLDNLDLAKAEQISVLAAGFGQQDKLLTSLQSNISQQFQNYESNQTDQEKLAELYRAKFLDNLDLAKAEQISALAAGFSQQDKLLTSLQSNISQQFLNYESNLKNSELRQASEQSDFKNKLASQKWMSITAVVFSAATLGLTILMYLKK